MSTIIFLRELKFLLNMSERENVKRKSGKNNHQNNAQQDILDCLLVYTLKLAEDISSI